MRLPILCALVFVLVTSSGCPMQDTISVTCPTGTSGESSLFVLVDGGEDGGQARIFVLQESSDGGAVAFEPNQADRSSWGTSDQPNVITCNDEDACGKLVRFTPVADGEVTLNVFSVANNQVELVGTCVVFVRGDEISPDSGSGGFATVAFRTRMEAVQVKPGLAFDADIFVLEPLLTGAETLRVVADPRLEGGPWDFPYPKAERDPKRFDLTVTVASDATRGSFAFDVQLLDANGTDLNADGDDSNNYSGDSESILIDSASGDDFSVELSGPSLHFEAWNPYQMWVAIDQIPDEATELRILRNGEYRSNSNQEVTRGALAGSPLLLDFTLLAGETTFSTRWYSDLLGGYMNCSAPNDFVIATEPGGLPLGVSWTPWIPTSGELVTLTIQTQESCDTDSTYETSSSQASFAASELIIPADETRGSVQFTAGAARMGSLAVIGSAACEPISNTYSIVIHPAGDDLLDGFEGPVEGDAGARGTLEIAVAYSLISDRSESTNLTDWLVTYTETRPESFAIALSPDAFDGSGNVFQQIFDGPGGRYTATLRVLPEDPYEGMLEGTFELTRPDATVETFEYSLPKK